MNKIQRNKFGDLIGFIKSFINGALSQGANRGGHPRSCTGWVALKEERWGESYYQKKRIVPGKLAFP